MKKSRSKNNILFITTNRSEYGLQRDLIKEFKKKNNFNTKVVVAGSHLLKKFGKTIDEIKKDKIKIFSIIKLNIKNDDPYDISLFNQKLGIEINKIFSKSKIDLLFLLGDRSEILNIAGIAKVYNIPIAHLHGGETTQAAIDDSIRDSVSKLSDYHFVSHDKYRSKLLRMNINKESIFTVGGLGASRIEREKFINKKKVCKYIGLDEKKKIIIASFHPVTLENKKTYDYFRNLISALSGFNNLNIVITSPNFDVNYGKIYKLLDNFIKKNKNVYYVKSLGSELYFSLLKISSGIVGNSSSGILEAPSFNIGTVNIGNRQKGRIQSNSVVNCDAIKEEIIISINKILYDNKFLNKIKVLDNPYFKHKTEQNIVNITNKLMMSKNFNHNLNKNKNLGNSKNKIKNIIINKKLLRILKKTKNPYYLTDIKKKIEKNISQLLN